MLAGVWLACRQALIEPEPDVFHMIGELDYHAELVLLCRERATLMKRGGGMADSQTVLRGSECGGSSKSQAAVAGSSPAPATN